MTIPPVYNPPLSYEVVAYAEDIALELIDSAPANREDIPTLYRAVRACMNRPQTVNVDCPTLDDESISRGIVNALNATD